MTAELGTIDDGGILHPADEIPLLAGSVFGWRLELGCTGEISVREELRLPAPGDWGNDPDLTIATGGKLAQVQSSVPCTHGWIAKTWTLSPGDPPGVWVIRVTAEGFEPQTFRAVFAPPAGEP